LALRSALADRRKIRRFLVGHRVHWATSEDLSKGQVESVLVYLAKTRWPTRNRLIFLLSAKADLSAKEIAHLTWLMTNDSQGEIGRTLCLFDSASKGKSGRMIP